MEEILKLLIERDEAFEKGYNNNLDLFKLSDHYVYLAGHISEFSQEKKKIENIIQEYKENGIQKSSGGDISHLNQELVSLYRTKENLLNEYNAYENEISRLESVKIKIDEDTSIDNKKIEKYKATIPVLEEKVKDVQDKIQEADRECEAISSQFVGFVENIESLTFKIADLKKEIDAVQDYIESAEKTSTRLILTKLHSKYKLHTKALTDVCFGPGLQSIISVGADKQIRQISIPSLSELFCTTLPTHVHRIRLNEEINTLGLACEDHKVRLLDIITGRITTTLGHNTEEVTDIEWKSRAQIATASRDRIFQVVDINRDSVVCTINAIAPLFGLAKVDPHVFVGACFDGSLRVFDSRGKTVSAKIPKAHARAAVSVAASAFGAVSLGLPGEIALADLRTMSVVRREAGAETSNRHAHLCAAPAARIVFAPCDDGGRLFDAAGAVETVPLRCGEQTCAAFATNLLVTGGDDGALTFWTN